MVSGEESGCGEEEESAEEDDAGLSGTSPEDEEKERKREIGPHLCTAPAAAAESEGEEEVTVGVAIAAARAVEEMRFRKLPVEGKERRGWRGGWVDDVRPSDEEKEEKGDEGKDQKRGGDSRGLARAAQRNLDSIIG